MYTNKAEHGAFGRLRFLSTAGTFVCAFVLTFCLHGLWVFRSFEAVSYGADVERRGDAQGEAAVPGLSRHEDGFDVDKMWEILFKSPTAYQAEMKARERCGGRSPFAGKTQLKFSCYYPTSRRILIPTDFSDTQAALAYAYELRHFEQGDETLNLQAQLRDRAISMITFVDRCIELEARAAYQQVKVARELRKAWVFGAHSDWEPYCSSWEDEQTSLGRILAGIDGQGVVEGTGKTARGYYMWLASQKMQEAPDTVAPRETVAAGQ